jgi:hypothetical protein
VPPREGFQAAVDPPARVNYCSIGALCWCRKRHKKRIATTIIRFRWLADFDDRIRKLLVKLFDVSCAKLVVVVVVVRELWSGGWRRQWAWHLTPERNQLDDVVSKHGIHIAEAEHV